MVFFSVTDSQTHVQKAVQFRDGRRRNHSHPDGKNNAVEPSLISEVIDSRLRLLSAMSTYQKLQWSVLVGQDRLEVSRLRAGTVSRRTVLKIRSPATMTLLRRTTRNSVLLGTWSASASTCHRH